MSALELPPAAAAPDASPALSLEPEGTAEVRGYIGMVMGDLKPDEKQTEALIEEFFELREIPLSSPKALAVRQALLPAKAAAETVSAARLDPRLRRHRATVLKLAREHRTTPSEVEAVLKRRGLLPYAAVMEEEAFRHQAERTLDRAELQNVVASYPDNPQGRFMRGVADDMSDHSGSSAEEISRDGVFAYIDFSGRTVVQASSGRNPDQNLCQMVFYITRREDRWRIGGYRQNKRSGLKDPELERSLRDWLTSGGVPGADLE